MGTTLQHEGLEGDALGGDEELAAEGAFRGAAAERFLGGNAGDLGVIVLLGEVREDQVARASVETLGIAEKFADGIVGEMPGAALKTRYLRASPRPRGKPTSSMRRIDNRS